MDLTRRAMLNDFGLVQHAVYESADHNAVLVIYRHTQKAFVHTELTKELETRIGLQLVPPQSRVATSSSKGDGVVIVIVDSQDSLTDRLLREAVETTGHPDTHTLFLQKGRYRPDWVDNKLPRSALMLYPQSDGERSQFWTTLTTMTGEPDLDFTRRAMLNDFGLVQHAVFESPDHNAVHVIYRHTQKTFVHTELTKELETRTGLQLVPPQSHVATSSSKGNGVVIVIVDSHDSLTDRLLRHDSRTNRLLREAVETAGYPDTRTLFLQNGEYRPDWVDNKLPRSALMLYPESDGERSQFWTTLTTMIGEPDMDLARRAMLNDFGLVQHAVFESTDHNAVHVIYRHSQKPFVHTELTKELETRTGLQLVPPQSRVATSSSEGDGVVIVIVDSHDSLTDMLLREAVETAGHPDTHILFLQRGWVRPDWVDNKLPRSALMLGPQSDGERSQFWTTLTTTIGEPDTDLTRRAMLNDFGLVQHAVFESADHNAVHVIYRHTQKAFVHTELTKELETRTGLQLVPPQSRVAKSSSKGDSVVIVIVDSQNSLTDRLLREAVETAGHPDTHTLFLQKGKYRPDWLDNKLPRSALMLYPQSVNERPQFWNTVSSAIEHPSPGVGEAVEHGFVLPVTSPTPSTSSTFQQNICDDSTSGEDGTSDGSDEDDAHCSFCSTSSSSSSSGSSDAEGDGCPGPRDPDDRDCPTSVDTDPATGPQSRADTDPATGPQSRADTDPATGPQTRADTDPATGPQTRADTDPATGPQTRADIVAGQGRGLPPPIVSVHWQASWTVRSEGGCFRKTGSDVILQVPPKAVQGDDGVVIHAAICADVDRIRRVLNLSDYEQIVTPLAEYWAGQDFRFQSPVSITLPHFLPPDYDPDLVRVYHVTRTHDGRIIPTRINEDPETGKVPEDGAATLDDSDVRMEEKHPGCIQSEESHIQLFTDHFTGYACTYCDTEVKKNRRPRPQLYVMGSGSLTATPDSRYHLDVFTSIWDRRIKVADCRQEECIKEGDSLEFAELSDTLCGSQLRLTMRMWEANQFIHCLDQNRTPLLAVEKHLDSSCFLACKKCIKKVKMSPKSCQWALQSADGCRPLHKVKVSLDVTHNSADRASPPPTTVLVQLTSEHTSTTTTATQTDPHSSENTHVKELAISSSSGPFYGNAGMADGSPLSHLQASSTANSPVTNGSVPNGPTDGYMSRQTRPDGRLSQQVGAEDTASNSAAWAVPPAASNSVVCAAPPAASNSQMESESAAKSVYYQNCTFQLQSSTNTHNNNIRNLNEMNVGNENTTHVEAQAEVHAVGQPPDIPQIDLPDDATQLSLGQQ